MQDFLEHNYRIISIVFIIGIAIFAFLIGQALGKKDAQKGVTLSCSDAVLTTLAIQPQNRTINESTTTPPAVSTENTAHGAFLGSKNGTKYYPSTGCAGTKRIKPENIIWFQSAAEATLQGYSPGSC